jgi:hypothetical protein
LPFSGPPTSISLRNIKMAPNVFFKLQTPEGWSSAADYSACEHIGYMLDGGKLYGYCEIDGVPVTSCYVQNSASTPTNEVDYTYTAGKDKLIIPSWY